MSNNFRTSSETAIAAFGCLALGNTAESSRRTAASNQVMRAESDIKLERELRTITRRGELILWPEALRPSAQIRAFRVPNWAPVDGYPTGR